MSKRFAQVIILMEDKQQRSFVSRLLQELGYPVHKLKILPTPAGEGSGEAYVREQYPIQVKALRPRAQYQDVALVVTIDGDGRTVAERQQQLADQLVAAALDPRAAAEKIVHLGALSEHRNVDRISRRHHEGDRRNEKTPEAQGP